MPVIGTFNGANIIETPNCAYDGIIGPSSIQWDPHDIAAANQSPFTGQTQVYDWQQSYWSGTVSFPSMHRHSHDAWVGFLRALRGPVNVFLFGDPAAATPKGNPEGAPVVNGAGQTGYVLATRGWTPSAFGLLMYGDYISVTTGTATRLYQVTDNVNSDASGNATLNIWPTLRDLPTDGTGIVTSNCRGMFRLKTNVKDSINPGVYGLDAFQIMEAF
jgi:hypothetical protein